MEVVAAGGRFPHSPRSNRPTIQNWTHASKRFGIPRAAYCVVPSCGTLLKKSVLPEFLFVSLPEVAIEAPADTCIRRGDRTTRFGREFDSSIVKTRTGTATSLHVTTPELQVTKGKQGAPQLVLSSTCRSQQREHRCPLWYPVLQTGCATKALSAREFRERFRSPSRCQQYSDQGCTQPS